MPIIKPPQHPSIHELPLEESRVRVDALCELVAKLGPLGDLLLATPVDPKTDEEKAQRKYVVESARDALKSGVEMLQCFLPGMPEAAKEEWKRLEAIQPSPLALREFFKNYNPPPQVPDTVPSREEQFARAAREPFERRLLMERVIIAMKELLVQLTKLNRGIALHGGGLLLAKKGAKGN